MSKTILVMDMPDSCDKCPLFGNHYSDLCCRALNNRGINYPYPKDFRQKWCPFNESNDVLTVRLVRDFEGEQALFINDECVCKHEYLYPFDVLDALAKRKVIKFECA